MTTGWNGYPVAPLAAMSSASTFASTAVHNAIARKIRRRLLPLLFVLYVVAYLDRINVGFAALTMNHELGLSSEQYGLLSGMFFWGYFLFEVPSNLILERIGARVWIARILISWGLVALATGFAHSAMQLYPWTQQLALGADPRGATGHRWRCADVSDPAEWAGRGHIPYQRA